jgi:hypothetical protein
MPRRAALAALLYDRIEALRFDERDDLRVPIALAVIAFSGPDLALTVGSTTRTRPMQDAAEYITQFRTVS